MGASPRGERFGATRTVQSGGGVSAVHIFGYLLLLATGFQAGRMACSWGELGAADDGGGDSPATQRAILSRINRLERLAEAAALANPALAAASARRRADDPADRDARRLRKLATAPASAGSASASAGRCRDTVDKCVEWAAAGECKRNAAYMRETCAKSCDACAVAAGGGGGGRAARAAAGGGGDGERGADGCPTNRRPFHVIQTADSSTYQQWQSRMMYFHFKKQQAADPCSEMGGFTRLLNTFDGGCDDLCDEMPTFSVRRMVSGRDRPECDCDWTTILRSPRCLCDASLPSCDCPLDTLQCNFAQCGDLGFVVLNRPYGVLQFLQSDEWRRRVTEDYVIIAETDHLYMRTLPNRATATVPVGYKFGYMNAAEPKLCAAAQPYWTDCTAVDPVGPSPVIMHVDQLRKLTPHWFALSMALKRDEAANSAYGWVLEMWGYTLAAARMGIRHSLWPNIQVEPSALWHCDDSFTQADYYTFHFTYGLEYSLKGHPSSKVGEWSLNKRNYMAAFPPADLAPPPRCAGACAHRLWSLFSEAANGLPHWKGGGRGTLGWVKALAADGFDPDAPAARALVGSGPWVWRGRKYFFLQDGLFVADPPSAAADAAGRAKANVAGTWQPKPAGAGHSTLLRVELEGCSERCTLTAVPPAAGMALRSFEAECAPVAGGRAEASEGELAPSAVGGSRAAFEASREAAPAALRARVEGSGPWAWDGALALFFLQGGKLLTPWAEGEWGYLPDGVGVFANFVGEQHAITFGDCLSFAVVRKRDGAKSTGALHQPEVDAKCSLGG